MLISCIKCNRKDNIPPSFAAESTIIMENLTVGFIGLGLIGGSIAKALRKFHPSCRIMAYSRTPETVETAKQEGVIEEPWRWRSE